MSEREIHEARPDAGSTPDATVPPVYPPPDHIVRDLAPWIERSRGVAAILLPIVPELLDASGRPRTGVIATIVDIVAGETAIREVAPQWIATSNLSLQVGRLPGHGTLRATPRVLRKGRTTLVLQVDLDDPDSGEALGLSTLGFSILPSRNALQARVDWAEEPDPRTEFALPGSGFRKPLLEAIGFDFDPAEPGAGRLAIQPTLLNTLGALQGGVVAILVEAAGEHFGAARLGCVARVRGLEIHYLKLARIGPVRTVARAIGRTATGVLVRVELYDASPEENLLTVGTVTVDTAAEEA